MIGREHKSQGSISLKRPQPLRKTCPNRWNCTYLQAWTSLHNACRPGHTVRRQASWYLRKNISDNRLSES